MCRKEAIKQTEMEFDVWKVKLENQLTQATENESGGSDCTRVMDMAQLILHCGAFQNCLPVLSVSKMFVS